jgi:hypothetical protein
LERLGETWKINLLSVAQQLFPTLFFLLLKGFEPLLTPQLFEFGGRPSRDLILLVTEPELGPHQGKPTER